MPFSITDRRHVSRNYFAERTEKRGIMVHFTAGLMPGCEHHLATNTTKTNVPFIATRKAELFNYFDIEFWAHHTGRGKELDKAYVAIECECWGSLNKVDGLYLPWTKKKYQAVDPAEVVTVETFRGFKYFHRLTPKQLAAVIWLIWWIRDRIPSAVELITHADVHPHKTDWPPDHPDIVAIRRACEIPAPVVVPKPTVKFDERAVILEGTEQSFTVAEIQKRINFLIKNKGWKDAELNRLVKFRDNSKRR